MNPAAPVLVVGPPGETRDQVVTALQRLPCELRIAEDRASALHHARERTPALIVLDATEPAVALGLVRELRAFADLRDSHLVLHAEADPEGRLVAALEEDVDDLLWFPMPAPQLGARLAARLRRAAPPTVGEAMSGLEARQRTLRLVAHDINNPLTAIRILADVLLAETVDETARTDLQDVLEAADMASCIIESLSSMLRWEQEEDEPTWFPVRMDDVVREIAERPAMRRHVVLGELPVAEVRGDRRALQQGLTELLLNARRLTDGRGLIELSLERGAGDVTVVVAHPAMKIPAAVRPALLRPYGAVVAREARVPVAAVGLGYPNAIAEMHGGRIDLVDRPDGSVALRWVVAR